MSKSPLDPSAGAQPRVSVVIPAYRAGASIREPIEALLAQTMPRERFEIVVVDDGSPDDTAAQAAAFPGVTVITIENGGPGAARNRGVEASTGELIVFTDADCRPEPDFLEQLVGPLDRDPGLGGTKGSYRSEQTEWVARLVQLEYESRYEHMARAQAATGGIDFVDTYAACFRRDEFEAVGGFDEAFREASCEDQELSFRLAEHGCRMRFVAAGRVFHRHMATLRGYLRKKFKIGFFKVTVVRRHPGRAVRDSHTPQGLKAELLVAAALLGTLLASPALFALGLGTAALAALAVELLAFAALTARFFARVARSEPTLLLLAAPFLLARAYGLGFGFVWGLWRAPRLVAPPSLAAPPSLDGPDA